MVSWWAVAANDGINRLALCLTAASAPVVFLFFYFLFLFFYKNIFLFSKFTGIYPGRPAAGQPGPGRPAAGAAGAFLQKCSRRICAEANRGPIARQGAAGPPGRPAAGRPPPPALYKGLAAPTPSFASLKIQKKRKEREGGREAKLCRIFKPATAGNQNSSTLYKQFML
jgi:hypothetical protein